MNKRHFVVKAFLILVFIFSVDAHAIAGETTDLKYLQAWLQEGASAPKNVRLLMDNAWQNGYDYCKVSMAEDSESFVIEVAIDGLVPTLKKLAKSENETDLSILDQTRGLLLNHVNKVISLLGSEGETDLSFSFILLDDTKVLAHEYAAGAVIATVTVIRGEPISIESVFSSWNGTTDEAVISEDAALPTEMKETITKKEPTFILNTNSRKFHIPTCDSVGKMKEENRKEYFGQRDDLVSTGYSPCGSCHP